MNEPPWNEDTWRYYVRKKVRLQAEFQRARQKMNDARREMTGIRIQMAELDEEYQEQKQQKAKS